MEESRKMLRVSDELSDYQPLPHVDHHGSDSESTTDLNFELLSHRIIQLKRKTILALCALIVFLMVSNLVLLKEFLRVQALAQRLDSDLLYSPAQEAVEHEVVKFHAGPLNNENDDIYSLPPSLEVDEAWRDLYEIGAVAIPLDVEAKLPNQTHRTNDGKGLIVAIDVFHQLHCLNKIRKALYPDYYLPEDRPESPAVHQIHITHCLNSIRQSLQCSSDISLTTFNLQSIKAINTTQKPRILPSFNVVHTCRNFEKIREWTRARWVGNYLDTE